ncbi:MAG: hypothetical protein KAW12_17385, partial [Candidatus Aminicenantes bacterium]|nr:hypothetical protein [Candidatus Aminicenantes bacterium]
DKGVHFTQTFANHFDLKIKKKRKPYDNFINWLRKLYGLDYYIIFLLDEFDAFIEKFIRISPGQTAHFFDTFNVLKQGIPGLKDNPKAFGFVCASNCTFSELTKKIELSGSGFTFVQPEEMLHFTEKQLFELVDQYLQGSTTRFSEEEIKFCYKMTKGYPYFAQMLLSIMYEEKMEKQNPLTGDFLSRVVKKEFIKEFKKTIKEWKDQKSLPGRTIEKIGDIAREVAVEIVPEIIKNLKDSG